VAAARRPRWHAVQVREAPAPGDDRTQLERMVAGAPYRSDDPDVAAGHRRAVRLVDRLNHTPVDQPEQRWHVLTELLGSIGTGSVVRSPLACDYGSYIRIGEHTFVNFGLVALDPAPITIGDHVQIGPNVQLLTPTHPLDPDLRRAGWEAAGPIALGDNVWLGGGVIVLADVTIGENTVVGAGAVVTRDLPSGVVAVGNPARVIRRLDGGTAAIPT
jgi:maltose O-acetyltransferase